MNNKEFLGQLLQTNDVAVIQDIISNNPYFDAAHISKALQSKDPNDLHNASILIQNELWIQYLLTEEQIEINKTTTILEQNNGTIANTTIVDHLESVSVIEDKTIETSQNNSTTAENIFLENELVTVESKTPLATITPQVTTTMPNVVDAAEQLLHNEVTSKKIALDNEIATTEPIEVNETTYKETTLDADNTSFNPTIENEPITLPVSEANALKTIFDDIKNKNSDNSTPENIPISIEPYHTVDYFASQGIKVLNINTNDKLSIQLKSFTQWLKTMKKVDIVVGDNDTSNELQQHTNVVAMAEGSLIKNDILTENMVDVLVKQGKTNDAIALLEKLSLQDTTKSVYFASRIEQLKKY